MKAFAGITEVQGLKVTEAFEDETRQEMERLLPGSWITIKEVCITARDLKFRQSVNKVSEIRSGLLSCCTYAEKTLKAYENLPPAAKALTSSETYNNLIELVSALSLAHRDSLDKNEFLDGKLSILYREYIAAHIVKIMREKGVEPKMNRDLNHTSSGDDTYAQLVRLAIELTDDGIASPFELMKIMKQGLNSNILRINQVSFP